jgi:hypothetical protein
MGATVILSEFDRSETYPKIISVSAGKNMGYLSMDISDWTEQMLHEIPSVKFNIYTKVNSVNVKYDPVCIIMNTDNPKCVGIYDIPSTFYISIEPVFDPYCFKAHNELVENGLDSGTKWNTKTDTFPVDIKFITD